MSLRARPFIPWIPARIGGGATDRDPRAQIDASKNGCSVLILPDATGMNAMIAGGFLGLGLGAEVDALAYIASRAFGLRYLGRILGFLMIAFTLGLAFGPTLFGKPYDQFQNYQLALSIAAGIAALASGLIMTLHRGDLPFTSEGAGADI